MVIVSLLKGYHPSLKLIGSVMRVRTALPLIIPGVWTSPLSVGTHSLDFPTFSGQVDSTADLRADIAAPYATPLSTGKKRSISSPICP